MTNFEIHYVVPVHVVAVSDRAHGILEELVSTDHDLYLAEGVITERIGLRKAKLANVYVVASHEGFTREGAESVRDMANKQLDAANIIYEATVKEMK